MLHEPARQSVGRLLGHRATLPRAGDVLLADALDCKRHLSGTDGTTTLHVGAYRMALNMSLPRGEGICGCDVQRQSFLCYAQPHPAGTCSTPTALQTCDAASNRYVAGGQATHRAAHYCTVQLQRWAGLDYLPQEQPTNPPCNSCVATSAVNGGGSLQTCTRAATAALKARPT
jgi:hypothetical protein